MLLCLLSRSAYDYSEGYGSEFSVRRADRLHSVQVPHSATESVPLPCNQGSGSHSQCLQPLPLLSFSLRLIICIINTVSSTESRWTENLTRAFFLLLRQFLIDQLAVGFQDRQELGFRQCLSRLRIPPQQIVRVHPVIPGKAQQDI